MSSLLHPVRPNSCCCSSPISSSSVSVEPPCRSGIFIPRSSLVLPQGEPFFSQADAQPAKEKLERFAGQAQRDGSPLKTTMSFRVQHVEEDGGLSWRRVQAVGNLVVRSLDLFQHDLLRL